MDLGTICVFVDLEFQSAVMRMEYNFLRCQLEPPTQNVDLQAGSQALTLKHKPNTDFPWNWLAQAAYRSGGLPKRHSRLL